MSSLFTAEPMEGVVYSNYVLEGVVYTSTPVNPVQLLLPPVPTTTSPSLGDLSLLGKMDSNMDNSPWNSPPRTVKSLKRDANGNLVYAPFASETKRVFGVWERLPVPAGPQLKAVARRRLTPPTSSASTSAGSGPSSAGVSAPLPPAAAPSGPSGPSTPSGPASGAPSSSSDSQDPATVQDAPARASAPVQHQPSPAQPYDIPAANQPARDTGLASSSSAQSSTVTASSTSSPAPPATDVTMDDTTTTTTDNGETSRVFPAPAAAHAPASSTVSPPAVSAQPGVEASSDDLMDAEATGPGAVLTPQPAGLAAVSAVPGSSAGSWSAAGQVTATGNAPASTRPPATGSSAEMSSPTGCPSGMDVDAASSSTAGVQKPGQGSAPAAQTTESSGSARSSAGPSTAGPSSTKDTAPAKPSTRADDIHLIFSTYEDDEFSEVPVSADVLEEHIDGIYKKIRKIIGAKLGDKLAVGTAAKGAYKAARSLDVATMNQWLEKMKERAVVLLGRES